MRQKRIRIPRLSRRARLVRNLCAALLLVLGSWVLAGCPAWTEAGALRRLERSLLLDEGTVRYREDGDRWWSAPTVLVTGENYAYRAQIRTEDLFWHQVVTPDQYAALDEGAVLFRWAESGSGGALERGVWLCPDPPEGAQGAELTILLEYELGDGPQERDYEQGSATLYARGTLEDTGLLRLEIAAGTPREAVLLRELFDGFGYETTEDGDAWRGCAITRADWRLELLDEAGTSMGTVPVALAEET